MQVETFVVTVYRHESEKDRVDSAPRDSRAKIPQILGIVEVVGSNDLCAFFTREELLAHLGFKIRTHPDRDIESRRRLSAAEDDVQKLK